MTEYPKMLNTAVDSTDARALAEFYRQLLGLEYRAAMNHPPMAAPKMWTGWFWWTRAEHACSRFSKWSGWNGLHGPRTMSRCRCTSTSRFRMSASWSDSERGRSRSEHN